MFGTWSADDKKVDEYVLKRLLDFSDEICAVLDADFRFLYVNEKVKYLGYNPEELLGESIELIIGTAGLSVLKKFFEFSYKKDMDFRKEEIFLAKNGAKYKGIFSCKALLKPYGRLQFLVVIHIKRGDFSVHTLILDSIDSGVIFLANNDRIIYANPYAKRVLGVKETMSVRELPENVQKIMHKAKEYLRSHEFQLSQDRVLGVSSYPLYHKGKHKGWVVIFKDITELKRLREGIALLDKFSTLGVIASGLAHEIKNPLASMKLTIQNLEKIEDIRLKEPLAKLQRQIDRIDALLKSFFSYVRPVPPNPDLYSVRTAVEDVIGLVRGFLKKRNIQFINFVPSDIYIVVDYNQFQQILLNLILNSVDAMPDGGKLVIKAGETDGNCLEGVSKCVFITVEDTGIGIPDEIKEKIFYPFFTTKHDGVGLGLFIVHQLVKENNGRITVESKVGKGTKFTLYFPVPSEAKKIIGEKSKKRDGFLVRFLKSGKTIENRGQ